MAGNPYHDELGRFTDGPSGTSGLGGRAMKEAKKAFGADWKKLTPEAKQRQIKGFAKDLKSELKPRNLKKTAEKEVKKIFKGDYKRLTPKAKDRQIKKAMSSIKKGTWFD